MTSNNGGMAHNVALLWHIYEKQHRRNGIASSGDMAHARMAAAAASKRSRIKHGEAGGKHGVNILARSGAMKKLYRHGTSGEKQHQNIKCGNDIASRRARGSHHLSRSTRAVITHLARRASSNGRKRRNATRNKQREHGVLRVAAWRAGKKRYLLPHNRSPRCIYHRCSLRRRALATMVCRAYKQQLFNGAHISINNILRAASRALTLVAR